MRILIGYMRLSNKVRNPQNPTLLSLIEDLNRLGYISDDILIATKELKQFIEKIMWENRTGKNTIEYNEREKNINRVKDIYSKLDNVLILDE